jgi:hypothetical protein
MARACRAFCGHAPQGIAQGQRHDGSFKRGQMTNRRFGIIRGHRSRPFTVEMPGRSTLTRFLKNPEKIIHPFDNTSQ